jgi:predicted HNH restriction endonuclease
LRICPKNSKSDAPPDRVKRAYSVFKRNQKLIRKLKGIYQGQCQICQNKNLIETDSGAFYAEGHHLIPLGEEGCDDLRNVIILCPLCHKKLHYSKDRAELKEEIRYSPEHERMLQDLNNRAT